MLQGKITEAGTPTIPLDATPSGLISDPPPSSPHFFTPDRDALAAATLPLYSGLGQAPDMLACIPSSVTVVTLLFQCVDTVGLESGRASSLSKIEL